MLCGARTKRGGICHQQALKDRRRCKHHGGRWKEPGHRRSFGKMRLRVELHQAMRKAMGLPWYGGRLPAREKIDRMVEKAIEVGRGAVEVLEVLSPLEAQAEHAGELLLQGMQKGLMVGVDICEGYVQMRQTRSIEQIDLKYMRLASDTAGWMCRLGAKVMDEVFQRKRDDHVGKLLEQLRQAEDEKKGA